MGELKERLTFSEFLEWAEFLQQEDTKVSKQDRYLAQIAAEVARFTAKNPKKIKAADFLLRVIPVDKRDAMAKSKAAWFAAVGFDPNKN